MAKDTGTAEAKKPAADDEVAFVGASGAPDAPEKKKDLTSEQPVFQENPANAAEEEERAKKAKKAKEEELNFGQQQAQKAEQEEADKKKDKTADPIIAPVHNQPVDSAISKKDMEALNDAWGIGQITKAFDESLQNSRINYDGDSRILTFKLANNSKIQWFEAHAGVQGFIGFPNRHKMDDLDAKMVVGALASQGKKEIRVYGDRGSKEKMWLEAMRQGLAVTNFEPIASNDPNSVYQKWLREMESRVTGAAADPNAPTPETPAEAPANEAAEAAAETPAKAAVETADAETPATPAAETAEAEKPAQPKTTDVEGLSVKITGIKLGGANQYSSITGTVVGGDEAHAGKEVFVLVSNEAAQQIMDRPDVAPHIQPTVYEPEAAQQEDGTTKVKLRAEEGEAPDSSKTLEQAIQDLPPVKFDQITVNNEVSNDKTLEGYSGIKGNTASFAFEDAPKDDAPKEEAKADAKAAAPATEAEKPAEEKPADVAAEKPAEDKPAAVKSSFLADKPAAEEVKADAPAQATPAAEEKAPEKPAAVKSSFIGDATDKKDDALTPTPPEVPRNESFEETLARRIEQTKNPKVEAALRTLKAELDNGNLKLDGIDREFVHAKLSGSKALSVKSVNAAIGYAAGKPENKGVILPTVDDDKPNAPQQKRKNPGLG